MSKDKPVDRIIEQMVTEESFIAYAEKTDKEMLDNPEEYRDLSVL